MLSHFIIQLFLSWEPLRLSMFRRVFLIHSSCENKCITSGDLLDWGVLALSGMTKVKECIKIMDDWKRKYWSGYVTMSYVLFLKGFINSYNSLSCTATLFLEFWKRHRASFVCEWKVSDWCEEEVSVLHIKSRLSNNRAMHGFEFTAVCLLFQIVGGTDPGNCEQRTVSTQET